MRPFFRIIFGVFGFLAVLPLVASCWIYYNTAFAPSNFPSLFHSSDFFNSAMWVQAFVTWATFIAIALATIQIAYLHEQNERERERVKGETFLRLVSPEIISTKRLLAAEEIQSKLKEFENRTGAPQMLLNELRESIAEISTKMRWPLLAPSYASLDHVELLLDNYNYLAKQIIEHKYDHKALMTDLTLPNFRKTYENALPFIKLRRRLSDKYATDLERVAVFVRDRALAEQSPRYFGASKRSNH